MLTYQHPQLRTFACPQETPKTINIHSSFKKLSHQACICLSVNISTQKNLEMTSEYQQETWHTPLTISSTIINQQCKLISLPQRSPYHSHINIHLRGTIQNTHTRNEIQEMHTQSIYLP